MHILTAPARTTARPVPAWARTVAIIAALSPVPSSLWRLPLIFGVSMGMEAEFMDSMMSHALWQRAGYLVGLGVVADGCAFLTLGLVRWWGEVWPGWVPFVAGRRIPPLVAIVPALAGGLGASAFGIPLVLTWHQNVPLVNGWAVLMTACYAPLALWGPAVLAATAAYAWRRSPGLPLGLRPKNRAS
jgi:hypothetical protein